MSVFQSLVTALVLSRLDNCNSLLTDLPANLVQRLQLFIYLFIIHLLLCRVSSARAECRSKAHLQPKTFVSLHWLRAPPRITFNVALPTYRAVQCTALHYHICCLPVSPNDV